MKLEKQVEELNTAVVYLNKRIGTDNINDSDESDSTLSDDEETRKIIINTRHEEYDTQFASSYPFKTNVIMPSINCNHSADTLYIPIIFSLQVRGDRLYLHDDLKLKLGVVEMLKRMGSNYPENTSDFDEEFLYRSMKSIFPKIQLRKFANSQNLSDLDRPRREFLKSNFNIYLYSILIN